MFRIVETRDTRSPLGAIVLSRVAELYQAAFPAAPEYVTKILAIVRDRIEKEYEPILLVAYGHKIAFSDSRFR